MRALILLLVFISSSVFAKNCKQYEELAKFMDVRKFREASKASRMAGLGEPTVLLGDINQAKAITYRFPALEEMGFGRVGNQGWAPYYSRMESSPLHGMKVGYEIKNERGFARVRLDWDKNKGPHYNIEITEKTKFGKAETHKLAVQFPCPVANCADEKVARKWIREVSERMQ